MTRTELEFAGKLAAERCESAHKFLGGLKLPNGVHHVEMLLTFDDGAIMDVEAHVLQHSTDPAESPVSAKSDTRYGIAAVALIGIVFGWWLHAVTA